MARAHSSPRQKSGAVPTGSVAGYDSAAEVLAGPSTNRPR